ncbi:MAG TPA: transposase, partial [Thermoanaerobaculia bacterium]
MRYDPDKHHRRSIRLKGYDYSQAGAYFVTVCVQQRECLFGEVESEVVRLNDSGTMVEGWWEELEKKFSTVVLDEWILMPNHLHGILFLNGRATPATTLPSLGDVMGWFKTMTTNEYIRGVRNLGWRCFPGKLWQRDFFDHIIRTSEELERIREYIRQNPSRWHEDPENPNVSPPARAAT